MLNDIVHILSVTSSCSRRISLSGGSISGSGSSVGAASAWVPPPNTYARPASLRGADSVTPFFCATCPTSPDAWPSDCVCLGEGTIIRTPTGAFAAAGTGEGGGRSLSQGINVSPLRMGRAGPSRACSESFSLPPIDALTSPPPESELDLVVREVSDVERFLPEGGVTEPLREPWDERSHGMSISPRPSNFRRLAKRGGDADFEPSAPVRVDRGVVLADSWLLSSSDELSDESESEINAIGLVCSPPLPLCADAIAPRRRAAAAQPPSPLHRESIAGAALAQHWLANEFNCDLIQPAVQQARPGHARCRCTIDHGRRARE